MRVTVHSGYSAVAPFIDTVQQSADHFKDALGFLPQGVYRDAAEQGKLFVATLGSTQGQEYVGHLLFGGTFPHCRVFQLFVAPAFQSRHIGRDLIARLVKECETNNYLTIRARVADDLPANKFWERAGFSIFKTEPGGTTRNRTINVRVRHLDTPSLFSQPKAFDTSLGIVERFAPRNPVYAIDLNVFFDSIKKRGNEEEALALIAASLKNLVRMAVTEEFIVELERNSLFTPDPLLKFAEQLPQLRAPHEPELHAMSNELAQIVFPNQFRDGHMSAQDWSDLRHLATAIHHGVAGFITNEKAILRSRQELLRKYGIDVVGPQEFAESMDFTVIGEIPSIAVDAAGTSLTIKSLKMKERAAAVDFLRTCRIPEHLIAAATNVSDSRRCIIAVDHSSSVFGFAAWDTTTSVTGVTDAFICIDENNQLAPTVSDACIIAISADASAASPALVQLRLSETSVTTHTAAIAHGFRMSNRGQGELRLQKIVVGRTITRDNWAAIRHRVNLLAEVELPESFPSYTGENSFISLRNPTGAFISVRFSDFEDLLGPAILIAEGRDGVVVPIRRGYSDVLLQATPQLSLLSAPESILLRQRAYFNSERSAFIFKENAPILFYESQGDHGRGAIVAIARVTRTELVRKSELTSEIQRRGVVDQEGLRTLTGQDRVSATLFDNLLKFRHPVQLGKLKDLGCCPPNNFITASRLSSQQILSILQETDTYV